MRKIAVSAALSVAVSAAALLVGASPALAWTQKYTCWSDLHNWTEYGYLSAEATWSGNVETNISVVSSDGNPIKSESFARLYFSDGSTKDYKYTKIVDKSNSGAGITYSNPVNHPGVTKVMFHTYIGPDDNVWGCEEVWKKP
ncbi:hypothetical protein [Actinoplanes sp. N902-109]|uniref:hypothetical protein n=1 Tax=Actinoplanes sp. (strain N902-109) TaxID=649831 RepID=UPI00032941A5|nr:hypothetical protein [Actinoplanes sp. N902-109]AGL16421.1 hypothetical protein L083_2911 [Actinoplanes sp. N902-109]